MKALYRFATGKLSQKMILSLTIIMTVVGFISAYLQVKTQEEQTTRCDDPRGGPALREHHECDLARDACRPARCGVRDHADDRGLKQGINRIRIFNKEGRVMFSTHPGDNGQVDKDAEILRDVPCARRPLVRVGRSLARTGLSRPPAASRVLAMVTPIYNEPSCSDADCHAHPAADEGPRRPGRLH